MSGLAYFFKPKITANDSTSSTGSTEKRSGRRSKAQKSTECVEKDVINVTPVEPITEVSEQTEPLPPNPTPKIKLKFNLRSQSVQDTSDDRIVSTVQIESPTEHNENDISNNNNDQEDSNEENDGHDDDQNSDVMDDDDDQNENDDENDDDGQGYESSEMEMPLKIDETATLTQVESEPVATINYSPTKKKNSSRKKVFTNFIEKSASTLAIDESSPIKTIPHESQFSEHKQTKSGRTIKYTPYFRELVQGISLSPPSSPVHSTSVSKRGSNHSKKRQSSIKADLDAIKSGSLPSMGAIKSKRTSNTSPKNKKSTAATVKRAGQTKKTPSKNKSNRSSNAAIGTVEQLESDEETELNQTHSDDDDFRQDENLSDEEQDAEDDEAMDHEDEQSSAMSSDEEEWTRSNNKNDHDRTLKLSSTLASISSEMLDGYSLWAMKYRARHRAVSLDDKRLCRTWKKMSAHDRQRWCLKAEKENFHFPITAELLKSTSESTTTKTAGKTTTTKRKKTSEDHPPILLQKTLNQYSKTQPSMSAIRPPQAFVKQTPTVPTTPMTNNSVQKNYDVVDIAAGLFLLGESLIKMGEKVRQLGHLNPRGASAVTSIDNLSAILFDGTLCACNLMACLGNEITSNNTNSTRSDPLTNKLMENFGIILPGLS